MTTIAIECALASSVWADPVAKIRNAADIVSVAGGNQAVHYVVRGDTVEVGETISTSGRGFAMLAFTDGAQVTLRPATILRIVKYAHGNGDEAMRLNLLKGGVRARSGLIAERNPEDGFVIENDLQEVRIHGAEVDVRMCDTDCPKEAERAQGRTPPALRPLPVARLVSFRNRVQQTREDGKVLKNLGLKAPIFVHDTIETWPPAFAALAFKDSTIVTLPGSTIFFVDEFRFDDRKPQNGRVVLRLIEGAAQITQGQVSGFLQFGGAAGAPSSQGGESPGAGPQGLALPPQKTVNAAVEATQPYVDAASYATTGSPSGGGGGGGAGGAGGGGGNLRNIALMPPSISEQFKYIPAPNRSEVDFKNLFATTPITSKPGLYILVWQGHVTVSDIDLGDSESGWVDRDRSAFRLDQAPPALLYDPTPRSGGQGPSSLMGGPDLATQQGLNLNPLRPSVCVP